jgi:hypothetical protein
MFSALEKVPEYRGASRTDVRRLEEPGATTRVGSCRMKVQERR